MAAWPHDEADAKMAAPLDTQKQDTIMHAAGDEQRKCAWKQGERAANSGGGTTAAAAGAGPEDIQTKEVRGTEAVDRRAGRA